MPKALGIVLKLLLIPAFFAAGLYGGPHLARVYRDWFPPPQYRTGDFDALYARAGHPVVMYATSTCPYCAKVRTLFAQRGVAYTEYQIDRSQAANAEFQRIGGIGVPLLFIGERRIAGYRERTILDALAVLPQSGETAAGVP